MNLNIQKTAWTKILTYSNLAPGEISGLGKVAVKDGELMVTDVAIFEQDVSGSHSDITAEALAKFQSEMIKKGESLKEWCLWWHSHAHHGVFFSKTDTDTIEASTEFPWLVSLVVNKKHESKARLDVTTPVKMYADLDVFVMEDTDDKIIKLCQKEIDKKLKKPEPMGYKHSEYPKYEKTMFDDLPKKEMDRVNMYQNKDYAGYLNAKFDLRSKIRTLTEMETRTEEQEDELTDLEETFQNLLEAGADMGWEK